MFTLPFVLFVVDVVIPQLVAVLVHASEFADDGLANVRRSISNAFLSDNPQDSNGTDSTDRTNSDTPTCNACEPPTAPSSRITSTNVRMPAQTLSEAFRVVLIALVYLL